MTDDLKPCPFCGWDAPYVQTTGVETEVYCQNCTAVGPMVHSVGPDEDVDEVAIRLWNRRAVTAPYMTDLMVDPEGIDAFLEANPLTPKSVDDSLAADPAVKPAQKESDGEVLDRLGMDGVKWAAEFRTTALRLGYSDMDEGWLIGWFCNAIMAGYDRRKPTLAEALEVPEVKALVEAANEHIAFMEGTGLTFDFLGKLRAALRQIGGEA